MSTRRIVPDFDLADMSQIKFSTIKTHADMIDCFSEEEYVIFSGMCEKEDANKTVMKEWTRFNNLLAKVPVSDRPVIYFSGRKLNEITAEQRAKYAKDVMWPENTTMIEAAFYNDGHYTICTGMAFPPSNFGGGSRTQFEVLLMNLIPVQFHDKFTEEQLNYKIINGEEMIHVTKPIASILNAEMEPDMTLPENITKLSAICFKFGMSAPTEFTAKACHEANMKILGEMFVVEHDSEVKELGRLAICNSKLFLAADGEVVDGVTARTFQVIGDNSKKQALAFMARLVQDPDFFDYFMSCRNAKVLVTESAIHKNKFIDDKFGSGAPPRLFQRCWEVKLLNKDGSAQKFYKAFGNGWEILVRLFDKILGTVTDEEPTNEAGDKPNLIFWEIQKDFLVKSLFRIA